MKYSDEELFEWSSEYIDTLLTTTFSAHDYFNICINRLKQLIEESVAHPDWLEPSKHDLLNYRLKSIKFYQRKMR